MFILFTNVLSHASFFIAIVLLHFILIMKTLNIDGEIIRCLQGRFELPEGLSCCVQHNVHYPVAAPLYNLYSNLTLKQQGCE